MIQQEADTDSASLSWTLSYDFVRFWVGRRYCGLETRNAADYEKTSVGQANCVRTASSAITGKNSIYPLLEDCRTQRTQGTQLPRRPEKVAPRTCRARASAS